MCYSGTFALGVKMKRREFISWRHCGGLAARGAGAAAAGARFHQRDQVLHFLVSIEGCTTTRIFGVAAARVTGAKSFKASNGGWA
jgi:hypothetical protein